MATTYPVVQTKNSKVGINQLNPSSDLHVVSLSNGISIDKGNISSSAASLAECRSIFALGYNTLRNASTVGFFITNVSTEIPALQAVNSSNVAKPISLNPFGGNVGVHMGTSAPTRSLMVNGDVSADNYYDRNNESYYVNGAGESILKRVRCGTSTSDNNGTVSLSLNDGSLHMRAVTDFNHKMWYYDGIAFSTNPSHGHFRFYGDSVQRNNGSGGSTLRFDIDVQNAITTCHGELRSTGDVIAYSSDERLKTNIKQIPDAIEKVKALKGVTYDWVENIEDLGFKPRNKKDDIGLIAQDLEKVLPQVVAPAPFDHEIDDENGEMVSKSGEGYKTVQYDKVVPLLIEAIKEQQKQIDEIKNIINNK